MRFLTLFTDPIYTATGNAAEGISPREHQREGGTRLREAPGLDAALPRARHMFPQDQQLA